MSGLDRPAAIGLSVVVFALPEEGHAAPNSNFILLGMCVGRAQSDHQAGGEAECGGCWNASELQFNGTDWPSAASASSAPWC
jgi:hypothetical protein